MSNWHRTPTEIQMKKTRIQLAEQRAKLIAKAAKQREELTQAFSPLHHPLAVADKGLHVLRYIGQHPVLLVGVVAIAVMIKPKRWLMLLENGWLMWRMVQNAKQRLEG